MPGKRKSFFVMGGIIGTSAFDEWVNSSLGNRYRDADAPVWPSSGSYPFTRLYADEQAVTFSILNNKSVVPYNTIKAVRTSRLSGLQVIGEDRAHSFGVFILQPERLVEELQKHGVRREVMQLDRLRWLKVTGYLGTSFLVVYWITFVILISRSMLGW